MRHSFIQIHESMLEEGKQKGASHKSTDDEILGGGVQGCTMMGKQLTTQHCGGCCQTSDHTHLDRAQLKPTEGRTQPASCNDGSVWDTFLSSPRKPVDQETPLALGKERDKGRQQVR